MKKNNFIKALLLIVFCAIIAFFILRYRKQIMNINIEELKAYILGFGAFSAVIFIIIYSIKPIVLIIPSGMLSILAGTVYGPYKAFVLSMVSCFLSATLAFYLAKFLGQPFVNKLLKGKAIKMDASIEKHGFKIITIMRLSVVFPYDALSYACGLSRMRYRDFILGTLIGICPEMISYSFMGNHITNPFSLQFILPLVVVALLGVCSYYLYQYTTKREQI